MHVESKNIDLGYLVTSGQRQGYLTYSQINDQLPRGVTDVDAMEDILRLLEKSGVPVHFDAPSAEEILDTASDSSPKGAKPGAGDLSLELDPEATTDPVAHYFRDMGEIKRLEPADEVSLAKRVEQNLRQITQALALCPAAVTVLLDRFASGAPLEDIVSQSASESDDIEDFTARLAHIRQTHENCLSIIVAKGPGAPELDSLRHTLVSEMGELHLARRMHDELVSVVRTMIEKIRDAETILTNICVERARMPRRQFIDTFVGYELNPRLVDRLIEDCDGNEELKRALRDEMRAAQGDIAAVVNRAGLGVGALKTIGRSISTADATAKRAREAMVEANLRLVVSIAKTFNNRGVAFSDLVQEGNIGLMKAVEHFDYRKSGSFARQASWWIRRAINQSMGDQGHAIHVPAGIADRIHRVNRLTRQLSHELGRDPTPEELAAPLDLSKQEVVRILRLAREPMSLDAPLGDDEGTYRLGDHIIDANAEGADMITDRQALVDTTRELLDNLSSQEAAALRLHFGIGTDQNLSYEQIGEQFSLSREKIRHIAVRALKKLRDPEKAAALRALLSAVDD